MENCDTIRSGLNTSVMHFIRDTCLYCT